MLETFRGGGRAAHQTKGTLSQFPGEERLTTLEDSVASCAACAAFVCLFVLFVLFVLFCLFVCFVCFVLFVCFVCFVLFCFVCLFVCWFVGLLVCWFVGLLVCLNRTNLLLSAGRIGRCQRSASRSRGTGESDLIRQCFYIVIFLRLLNAWLVVTSDLSVAGVDHRALQSVRPLALQHRHIIWMVLWDRLRIFHFLLSGDSSCESWNDLNRLHHHFLFVSSTSRG